MSDDLDWPGYFFFKSTQRLFYCRRQCSVQQHREFGKSKYQIQKLTNVMHMALLNYF